eukprot:6175434-Pleurochrysis_carterae.AAC.4
MRERQVEEGPAARLGVVEPAGCKGVAVPVGKGTVPVGKGTVPVGTGSVLPVRTGRVAGTDPAVAGTLVVTPELTL